MNLVDLLENAVIDVLYRTLNWTETIQNVTQHLDDQSVEVVSIGSSNAARTVQLTLEQTGKDVLVSKNVEQTIFSDSQRSCSQDIAITGMSGRFPGAEDLDQFWELLLAGRDMHQQVNLGAAF